MYLVGLTGGIGSGKSTVAKIFKFLGVPVFDADSEAKLLYSLENVKSSIKDLFGDDVFSEGEVDFKKMSELVFSDHARLKKLESILYPILSKRFEDWKQEKNAFPYLIKEAAVMIEKGSYKDLDKIILITAPEELRIERVMKRNDVEREFVLSRIRNQWSDEKKSKFSDFIIRNDESASLLKQVIDLHQRLLIQAELSVEN